MRLKMVRDNEPRTWECTNNGFSAKTPCYHTEQIPGDYRLSILEIAKSIRGASSGFSTSDDFKKDQANIRRILGGLKKLRLQPYMSDDEREALATVATLLDRFGDAAEKAKKLKKQEEDAEAARRAKREQFVKAAIDTRYKSQDMAELVVHVLAISKNILSGYSTQAWELDTLDEIREDAIRRKREKPYSSATNQILQGFRECVAVLASDIGYEKRPAEELLDEAIEGIEASIADLKKTSSDRLDAFNQWLIEQKIIESNDGTVVRL
ncbi:MAG: hypothetical protein AB2814_07945 [Candidatus Sedimenticola endophacoides]